MNYKTIVIDESIHEKLKKYCKKKKLKINEFVNMLIENELSLENSKLPLILKNDGEIVETIICSEISYEIKHNMPKSITLIKSNKDGSGSIGNYTIR